MRPTRPKKGYNAPGLKPNVLSTLIQDRKPRGVAMIPANPVNVVNEEE